MADVTIESVSGSTGDGSPAAPTLPADPRAVRIAIAATTQLPGEAAVVVAPPPVPLAPVADSLAGSGPLGGVARGPDGDGGSTEREELAVSLLEPAVEPGILVDGEPTALRLVSQDRHRALLVGGGRDAPVRHRVVFSAGPTTGPDGLTRREVVVDGWRIELEIEPERRAALRERARTSRQAAASGGPTEVHAIIPGRVVTVSVESGESVTAGQQLLIVEAMKMQNELRSPREGTIERIAVAPGVTIEVGDLLLVIE